MKKNFGVWIFLASEVLLFGTLIFLYLIFYFRYHHQFQVAAKDIHFYHGVANTFILLTSSYFVARAQIKKSKLPIMIAIALGMIFLLIKGHEYYDLTLQGKFPLNFHNIAQEHKLFLSFYGYLTFLHSLHVLIGIAALTLVLFWSRRKENFETWEEGVGLYWHFVDMVWVFLFPMFYLIGK